MRISAKVVLGAAVLVGALAAATIPAVASDDAGTGGRSGRRVAVSADQGADGSSVVSTAPTCDTTGRCNFGITATFAMTGSLSGTGVGTLAVVLSGADVYSTGMSSFLGTVARCGTGGFVYRSVGDVVGGVYQPATWEIVPGSGTGDLAGIRGEGTAVTTGAVPGAAYRFSGTVRCGHR